MSNEAPAANAANATPNAAPVAAAAPAASPAEAMVNTLAAERMASLTEPQRNAVIAVAGADPIKQLETVRALASTWAPSAPRDTAAAPNAPRELGSPAKPDNRSTYESLKLVNPVAAARYALDNGVFETK